MPQISPQQRFEYGPMGGSVHYGNPRIPLSGKSLSGAVLGGQPVAQPSSVTAGSWLDDWLKRERAKKLAARPQEIVKKESEMGLSGVSQYIGVRPTGISAPLAAAATLGINYWGQLGSSLGSYLPGAMGRDFAERKQVYDNRGQVLSDYLANTNGDYAPPSYAGSWETKALSSGIALPAELFNPSKKYMLANAAWHAARGWLEGGGLSGATISGGTNAAGEAIESQLAKRNPLLGRMGGIPGNVIGAGLEKLSGLFYGK